ncbi:MAG TPA: peptide chain release factor N(5)-glutamine methyltransferase [Chitinivibrionales bacterium]
MTLYQTLQSLQSRLSLVSADLALCEAERILQYVLNCSRSDLYIHSNTLISSEQHDAIEKIVERHKTHEPLPYIFKNAYFHSMELYIDNSVLIPRPDTEILVETILTREQNPRCSFLDIGIGSGAITAVLTRTRPEWLAVGIDISFPALRVARKNTGDDFPLVNADMLGPIKTGPRFDFIVSNPPYISSREMEQLDVNVKDFEPAVALLGGEDGLDFYRIISHSAATYLKDTGRIYCEIGADQAQPVRELFESSGWKNLEIIADLAGRSRVCAAVFPTQ